LVILFNNKIKKIHIILIKILPFFLFYVIFLRFYAPRFILSSSAQTTTIIIIIVLIMIGVIMNNYLTITIELLFNIT